MCHAVGLFLPSTNDATSHQSQIVKNEYLVSDFTIYFLMEILMKCRYDHLFVPWYLQFLLFSKWNHILSFITYCLIFKEYLWRWRLQCQWFCLGIAWIPFVKTAAPVPVKQPLKIWVKLITTKSCAHVIIMVSVRPRMGVYGGKHKLLWHNVGWSQKRGYKNPGTNMFLKICDISNRVIL